MNYDKSKYYYRQECQTCKHSRIEDGFCFCVKLWHDIDTEFVCDMYKLSRSKAKKHLHLKREYLPHPKTDSEYIDITRFLR